MTTHVDRYWQQFVESLPPDKARPQLLEAFFFGSGRFAAEIAALVLDGVKTATGSLLWAWEADGKPVPKVGDLSIVLRVRMTRRV
jgi:uncharacterized protein YhfF